MKRMIVVVLLGLTGCSVVHINNTTPSGKTSAYAYVPAWPWQDSAQVINKLTMSAKTNSFTTSLAGMQTETTNTNSVDLVRSVIDQAIRSAIAAGAK